VTFDPDTRLRLLADAAPGYLDVIDTNIQREFPNMPWIVASGPGPLPHHRESHPVFFGCFDWHSCVEMWWAAIRIMRVLPDVRGGDATRSTMHRLLTKEGIATETAFIAASRGFERPYGWGWLLVLQHELDSWADPDAEAWARLLRPLSDVIEARFASWLPMLAYPQRHGLHPNTAFALVRALPYARARASRGASTLLDAITEWALEHYLGDTDYPAVYEPGGADFLSGALTEAELMSLLLPQDEFASWLDAFLPRLEQREPVQLFTPGEVTDASDGQAAHLSGLNLSRSAGFLAIAAALPARDPRRPVLESAAEHHAHASLDAVRGSDYMQEHWLAAYATLLLAG